MTLLRCGRLVLIEPVSAVTVVKNVVIGSVMKSVNSGAIGPEIVSICIGLPETWTPVLPSHITALSVLVTHD